MPRPVCLSMFATVALFVSGCAPEPDTTPPESTQPAQSAPLELSLALASTDYRGGENEKHWHLTAWSLRNDSAEPIEEAVIVVSLFDDSERFLGHHAVTFGHLHPGETAEQKRLLFLKSDNIEQWRPRFESVHSRTRGDLTGDFRLTLGEADLRS